MTDQEIVEMLKNAGSLKIVGFDDWEAAGYLPKSQPPYITIQFKGILQYEKKVAETLDERPDVRIYSVSDGFASATIASGYAHRGRRSQWLVDVRSLEKHYYTHYMKWKVPFEFPEEQKLRMHTYRDLFAEARIKLASVRLAALNANDRVKSKRRQSARE